MHKNYSKTCYVEMEKHFILSCFCKCIEWWQVKGTHMTSHLYTSAVYWYLLCNLNLETMWFTNMALHLNVSYGGVAACVRESGGFFEFPTRLQAKPHFHVHIHIYMNYHYYQSHTSPLIPITPFCPSLLCSMFSTIAALDATRKIAGLLTFDSLLTQHHSGLAVFYLSPCFSCSLFYLGVLQCILRTWEWVRDVLRL